MDRVSERDTRSRIECHYVDALGLKRDADPATIARLAAAMATGRREHKSHRIVIARPGHSLVPPVRALGAPLDWELRSDGMVVGGEAPEGALDLPDDLPVGTYRLQLTTSVRGRPHTETATVLSAPPRAFQGRGDQRMWALGVQLYGVRSQRNWGHGDFTDLAGLLELAAGLGAAGIGLGPLHALFDDDAASHSPYSPNSRLFLNPLYIDLDAVAEFPGATVAGLEREISDLRHRELIDYAGVAKVKMRALRLAYERFRRDAGRRRQDFERFRQERDPVLTRFACFELLRRAHRKPWWEWPPPHRRPAGAVDACSADEVELTFFAYVQWIAEQQLQACCRRARDLGLPLGLYLDVAVGVRPDGFDAWSDQDAILPQLRVGAPPDQFNTVGQNWGLAAFNPLALEARDFEPFRALLAASMRNAGAIRIDHVLGLRRLWLIPEGMPPGQGAYVRYPLEALLAVVTQESVGHQCIVVGEDLGTVPEGLRETLADEGIWSYQVMLFERARDGSFAPPHSYRPDAVVTFSTHDLPTFAGWASGHDLDVKRSLGIDPGETDAERQVARHALRRALATTQTDFLAVAEFLGATASRLLVIALEDTLEVGDQANVPGTIDEHPNWRRRLPVALEELAAQPRLTAVAEAMAAAGRRAKT